MELSEIRDAVRKEVGWSLAADLLDARIDRAINFIYVRLIPNELKWRKLKVWGFIDLVQSVGSYNLLTDLLNASGGVAYGDRVRAIEPPIFLQLDDTHTERLGFTYDRTAFWAHYPPLVTETENQPKHVLNEGYFLHFRRVPDQAYVATVMAYLRPIALVNDIDEPVEDWSEAIIAGASAAILTDDEEENAASLWQVCQKFLESEEQADYVTRAPRLKERW